MIAGLLRIVLGILLIPINVGFSIAFYQEILSVQEVRSPELMILFGITAYLAFHVLVAAPDRAYVLGHELTHAATAWASGGKVKSIKVGAKKGSVTTDKGSVLVALAPYLIPIFALLWALGFGAASLFTDVSAWSRGFFFGLGVLLMFHLVFTVNALKQKQSDLDPVGPLLGLGLIYWVNITLVMAVVGVAIPEVGFWSYLQGGAMNTQEIFQQLTTQLFAG